MRQTTLVLFILTLMIAFSGCSSSTNRSSKNDDTKTYTNDLYEFSVPSDWDVSANENNDFYTINKDGKKVGEITEENIPPTIEDVLFSLKPSFGDLYYSKVLNNLFTEAAIFKYKRSYNEGDDKITKDMTEIGFVIDKKKGIAIKLIVDTDFTSEQTLLNVAKTFKYSKK